MDYFECRDGQLFAENVPVARIAEQYGTPCYVYSRATIERHWRAFDDALAGQRHLVCYAVKANASLAVLNVMARMGSGFDIVSIGELERVIAAGGEPAKVVFSGVAKRSDEMHRALEVGIKCFNIESLAELQRLNAVAAGLGLKAPVSVRVNPDVDAQTHPYISTGLKENKFGVDIDQAMDVFRQAAAMSNVDVRGVDCHIGSQLTQVSPFVDALERVLLLIEQLKADGIAIEHLDVGGGLGICYQAETPPPPAEYVRAVLARLDNPDIELVMEPGRAIVGNAGILVTQIEYLKTTGAKNFAIIDAGMNDLLRPSLYSAWQEIVGVTPRHDVPEKVYDIVGPVCETGDFLGKDRSLAISAGDFLAVRSAGAYGFSMSSNYNSRPRPAELMVDGDDVHVVRRRETLDELYAHERVLSR